MDIPQQKIPESYDDHYAIELEGEVEGLDYPKEVGDTPLYDEYKDSRGLAHEDSRYWAHYSNPGGFGSPEERFSSSPSQTFRQTRALISPVNSLHLGESVSNGAIAGPKSPTHSKVYSIPGSAVGEDVDPIISDGVGSDLFTDLVPIYAGVQRCRELRKKYMRFSLQRDGDNPKDDPDKWVIYPPPPPPQFKHRSKGEEVGDDFILEEVPIPGDASEEFELNSLSVFQVYNNREGENIVVSSLLFYFPNYRFE